MNSPPIDSRFETRFGGSLATDAQGRLYDRRFRAILLEHPAYRKGVDPGALEALAALRIAGKGLHLRMERWAERHGLSEGRLQLLMHVWHAPGRQRPLGELAACLDVTPRDVTGLVDHLERDGLVERVPDPADRRSTLAHLTPAGQARVEEVWEAFTPQHALTRGMTPEELVQLRHLCLRLVQNLTRSAAGTVPGKGDQ